MSTNSSVVQRPSIFDNGKRGCTDWPCLLIFIILLVLYFVFAIFVFREGSLRRFINPTDTQGRICGTNSQIHRKYLQFFDIVKCVKYVLIGARCPTPQMCVEQCPSEFYHYKLLYAQELKLTTDKERKTSQIRAQLSCEKSAQVQVENPEISIYSLVKERRVCAPYSFPSAAFYGRCVPSVIVQALETILQQADDIIKNSGGNTTDDDVIPDTNSMRDSLEYLRKALQIKRILSYLIEDLVRSRYILLLSLVFAMIFLLIYMMLLRCLARSIIWFSLILCILVFVLAAVLCFTARNRMQQYSKNTTDHILPDLEEMKVVFDDDVGIIKNTNSTKRKPSNIEKYDTAMILLNEFAPMNVIWLILGIVCCVICGILMVCTCCLCERIELAAGLIEEASKAICHALTTLLWPFVTFLLNIIFVIFGVLVMAHYSTLGRPIYQISCTQDFGQSCQNPSSRSYFLANTSIETHSRAVPTSCYDYNEGDRCNPDDAALVNCSSNRIRCVYVSYGFSDETFEHYLDTVWSHRLAQFLSQHSWSMNLFNLFIIYWLLAFTVAFEEMVLSSTFASYYWELNGMTDRCCHGYFQRCLCLQGVSITFRHHMGTIALGSSIIAIIDTVRTLLDLLKDRIESMNLNGYGKCCLSLIQSCLGCVRCCFRFFSRYTYIMTAISGKWFCPSAFTATRLLLENCLRVFVLDRVCALLLYIGRLTITIGSCVFTAYLLNQDVTFHFSWFPVLIIGIIVYTSSAIFLNVYSTATSTLFFCVLYDLEIHDGSQMEPYAMSNRLKRILSKSNDFRSNKFQTIDHSQPSDERQTRF